MGFRKISIYSKIIIVILSIILFTRISGLGFRFSPFFFIALLVSLLIFLPFSWVVLLGMYIFIGVISVALIFIVGEGALAVVIYLPSVIVSIVGILLFSLIEYFVRK